LISFLAVFFIIKKSFKSETEIGKQLKKKGII